MGSTEWDRRGSLHECLDSSKEPRRRKDKLRRKWRPWIMMLIMTSAIYYIYTHRADLFPDLFEPQLPVNVKIVANTEAYTKPRKEKVTKKAHTPSNVADTLESYDPKGLEYSDEAIKYKNETRGLEVSRMEAHVMPICRLKKSFGKVHINKTGINFTDENVHPQVRKGGYYRPVDCKPKQRVGIIVPYRDRSRNLGIFLYNIHPFLMNQKLEYQIFVIEQQGKGLFNKGRLYNAGFQEMMKFNTFHCVVFHDLDLLPMNSSILYTCPLLPRHLCAKVDDTDLKRENNQTLKFKSIFGGVVSMSVEQFQRANGFSNLYFGWGGEDNDIFWRLHAAGYPVVRYSKSVGVYDVLPHKRDYENPFRFHLLSRALERYKTDGLKDSEYYVIATKFYHLCTYMMVDINPREDNITEISMKWANISKSFN